jgi:arylsulfatase A-like enzyme
MLLYDSTLRVRWCWSCRAVQGVSDEPVSLADVAPTILRAAGLPPAEMKGGICS